MTTLDPAFFGPPLAHRALHDAAAGRPENSRAAIRAAVAAGYGIEIDLQLSADGQAMVFHDDELDRLTGATGPLSARTAEALGRITLTDSAERETVPTLAEVLDIVAGKVALLIEIKDQTRTYGPDVGPLEAATAQALAGYDGPVAVMSFNPFSVAAFGQDAPDIAHGLTTCPAPQDEAAGLTPEIRQALNEIALFDHVGASFISHQWDDLTSPAVTRLKARGVPVLCWTIRSPQDEARAREIADNVTFEGYRPPIDPA